MPPQPAGAHRGVQGLAVRAQRQRPGDHDPCAVGVSTERRAGDGVDARVHGRHVDVHRGVVLGDPSPHAGDRRQLGRRERGRVGVGVVRVGVAGAGRLVVPARAGDHLAVEVEIDDAMRARPAVEGERRGWIGRRLRRVLSPRVRCAGQWYRWIDVEQLVVVVDEQRLVAQQVRPELRGRQRVPRRHRREASAEPGDCRPATDPIRRLGPGSGRQWARQRRNCGT